MSTHRARKRFGQHFLHDPAIIERLVRSVAPADGQSLVEIGPGQGALTYPLLDEVDHLQVVELDRDLIALLHERIAPERITIHESDALRFDFAALADGRPLRVVGNLPYNISTPLIFHLLDQAGAIADMTFMLQKEVVDRLTAAPGGKDYGRLSVMVQYHCQADYLFFVPPGAFRPPPKVDSAVVRLTPYRAPPWPADDPAWLARLVAQAFSQRRKAIRNSLKSLIDVSVFATTGIDAGLRPDHLTVADYVALANASAAGNVPESKGARP
ncbi:16S rRNA (adenine(1518)-N(6)/adenine(1519)-N(6))-dimethyltransferase RsmA [Alloalcanivorax gelatiniphagus]|uniref:Ribosomal RNA small subunit methyltransferase A n=1 Tax=Alloalcanivorax gelatiniphagus TaxID=1194167 RepID=A0ABY2XQQ9_9GAMM|nr:16S rRNA (adenine(1518)-N(6)/adenine(1519)-N(6))-dimethyltransferase RsmA [Alloalcanivorax gelatiniphagus]TMW15244.1 16S rRNA (adenine(1518)-N(6)/adenine(1519)-N(6))-dimethyltransferase RsmA [Alloalcanivorax gelatiniphagus]|tara:strand:- start:18645 stop:19454 length:810 start_codon:yes stop_codon:yes gene_type:complete